MIDCIKNHSVDNIRTSNQTIVSGCPVCNNKDYLIFVDRMLIPDKPDQDPYRLRIAHCSNCQHRFQNWVWNEFQLKQYYNSETAYYRSDYSQNIPHASLVRFDSILDDLDSFIKNDWSHLDVGGYAAHFSYYMGKHVKESYCLDVSNYLPSDSKENVKIIKTTLSNFDSQGKQFDFISLNHVLEHLTNLQTVRKTILNLLKPSGFLLVEVPDELAQTNSMLDYTLDHTQYFTGDSLLKYLNGHFDIKIFKHFKYNKNVDVGQGSIYRVLAQKKRNTDEFSTEAKEKQIKNVITEIEIKIQDVSEIYVWGSGYHTRFIFSMSETIFQKTSNLIDSDSTRDGKIVYGKSVIHPSKLNYQEDTKVIVSSFDYNQEIEQSARSLFPYESIINPYTL